MEKKNYDKDRYVCTNHYCKIDLHYATEQLGCNCEGSAKRFDIVSVNMESVYHFLFAVNKKNRNSEE